MISSKEACRGFVSSKIVTVPVSRDGVNRSPRKKTIWVMYSGADITEAQVKNYFEQVAPVRSVSIMRCRRIGLVTFVSKEDTIKARDTFHSKSLNGYPLSIILSPEKEKDENVFAGCTKIFVKGFAATVDSKCLEEAFSIYGTILSCKVHTDSRGRSKRCGYVQFEKEKDAYSAIITQASRTRLCHEEICVVPFLSKQVRDEKMEEVLRKTVFVKNLSEGIVHEDFTSVFEKIGRVVYACTSASYAFGQRKGTGYITFEIEEEAARAVEEINGHNHDGQIWKVELAWNENSKSKMKQGGEDTNLYVKNINKSVDDEKLEELFSQFGWITSCKVMLDSQGKSKGFGFVAFSTHEEASKAVKEMNGKMIGSRSKPLYVAVAQRKEERESMLQACFSGVPFQDTVSLLPSGTSVSAPPYPVMPYHYQLGMGGWEGGYQHLMPPVQLLHHNANQVYIPHAHFLNAPANYAGFGHYG